MDEPTPSRNHSLPLKLLVRLAVQFSPVYLTLVSKGEEVSDMLRPEPIFELYDNDTKINFQWGRFTSKLHGSVWIDGIRIRAKPNSPTYVRYPLKDERVLYPGDHMIINISFPVADLLSGWQMEEHVIAAMLY